MWFIGRKWLNKPHEARSKTADSQGTSDLLKQYEIDDNLHYIQISARHEIAGKTLKELNWSKLYGVTALKVQKKVDNKAFAFLSSNDPTQMLTKPTTMIETDDILLLYAAPESIKKLLNETKLEAISRDLVEELNIQHENIAEVILAPQSNLINQSLKDINFRDKYGLTVLAIKRRNKGTKLPSAGSKLDYGDRFAGVRQVEKHRPFSRGKKRPCRDSP